MRGRLSFQQRKIQLKKLLKRKGELDLLVDEAENQWLQVSEEMEQFEAQLVD